MNLLFNDDTYICGLLYLYTFDLVRFACEPNVGKKK